LNLKLIRAFAQDDILQHKATFTDLWNLMRNFSNFSLAYYSVLLSVRKVSYIGER